MAETTQGTPTNVREQTAHIVSEATSSWGLATIKPSVIQGSPETIDRVRLLALTSAANDSGGQGYTALHPVDLSAITITPLQNNNYLIQDITKPNSPKKFQAILQNFELTDKLITAEGEFTLAEVLKHGPNAPIMKQAEETAKALKASQDR